MDRKSVDNKIDILNMLQRIRGMKNDLWDMEDKLIKVGDFNWMEVARLNKYTAIKMYKEKFGVDLKTAKFEVEDYLATS